MPTFRKERMGEAIRKVVCDKILRDHSLIPHSLVTINRVDVAPDYAVARIYYSLFGGNIDEIEAQALMKEHQAEFRLEISRKLNLRRTPRVEFRFDKNTEHAFKIEDLLKQANE